MAMKVACLMLTASISAAVEKPTATASARAMIASNSFSRASGVKSFESLRPRGRFCGSRMTAAAATGPASGPRPASSTPATGQTPRFKSRRSRREIGSVHPLAQLPLAHLPSPLRPANSCSFGRANLGHGAGASTTGGGRACGQSPKRPSARRGDFRPRPCIICNAAVRGERAPREERYHTAV